LAEHILESVLMGHFVRYFIKTALAYYWLLKYT